MFDATITFKRGEPPVNIIMNFKDENEFLSNFYLVPIWFEDRLYPATENAYFAWMSTDDDIKLRLQTIRPVEAKALAQTEAFKSQRKFKTQDELLAGMETLVRQKFFDHPELADKLLATGDALLIEGNTWGDENFGVNMQEGRGCGRNGLGQMLMKIRRELREMREGKGA